MKYFIIILIILNGSSILMAQDLAEKRKNVIYVEGAGPFVVGYGIGYERYLHIKPNMRFSLRAAAGAIDGFSKATSNLGGSWLYGRKSNLEAGINYLFQYDAWTFRMIDETNDDERFKSGIQSLIGYRYQNWENGITFRVYYVLPLGCCGSPIPIYGGLSLGYAF